MRLLLVVVLLVNVGDREGEEGGDLELELRSPGGKPCHGSLSARLCRSLRGLSGGRLRGFLDALLCCFLRNRLVPAAAAPTPGIMAIPISVAMLPTVMAAPAILIAVT
jgi:hypothetical protein